MTKAVMPAPSQSVTGLIPDAIRSSTVDRIADQTKRQASEPAKSPTANTTLTLSVRQEKSWSVQMEAAPYAPRSPPADHSSVRSLSRRSPSGFRCFPIFGKSPSKTLWLDKILFRRIEQFSVKTAAHMIKSLILNTGGVVGEKTFKMDRLCITGSCRVCGGMAGDWLE
jgi:hypothetical protein